MGVKTLKKQDPWNDYDILICKTANLNNKTRLLTLSITSILLDQQMIACE